MSSIHNISQNIKGESGNILSTLEHIRALKSSVEIIIKNKAEDRLFHYKERRIRYIEHEKSMLSHLQFDDDILIPSAIDESSTYFVQDVAKGSQDSSFFRNNNVIKAMATFTSAFSEFVSQLKQANEISWSLGHFLTHINLGPLEDSTNSLYSSLRSAHNDENSAEITPTVVFSNFFQSNLDDVSEVRQAFELVETVLALLSSLLRNHVDDFCKLIADSGLISSIKGVRADVRFEHSDNSEKLLDIMGDFHAKSSLRCLFQSIYFHNQNGKDDVNHGHDFIHCSKDFVRYLFCCEANITAACISLILNGLFFQYCVAKRSGMEVGSVLPVDDEESTTSRKSTRRSRNPSTSSIPIDSLVSSLWNTFADDNGDRFNEEIVIPSKFSSMNMKDPISTASVFSFSNSVELFIHWVTDKVLQQQQLRFFIISLQKQIFVTSVSEVVVHSLISCCRILLRPFRRILIAQLERSHVHNIICSMLNEIMNCHEDTPSTSNSDPVFASPPVNRLNDISGGPGVEHVLITPHAFTAATLPPVSLIVLSLGSCAPAVPLFLTLSTALAYMDVLAERFLEETSQNPMDLMKINFSATIFPERNYTSLYLLLTTAASWATIKFPSTLPLIGAFLICCNPMEAAELGVLFDIGSEDSIRTSTVTSSRSISHSNHSPIHFHARTILLLPLIVRCYTDCVSSSNINLGKDFHFEKEMNVLMSLLALSSIVGIMYSVSQGVNEALSGLGEDRFQTEQLLSSNSISSYNFSGLVETQRRISRNPIKLVLKGSSAVGHAASSVVASIRKLGTDVMTEYADGEGEFFDGYNENFIRESHYVGNNNDLALPKSQTDRDIHPSRVHKGRILFSDFHQNKPEINISSDHIVEPGLDSIKRHVVLFQTPNGSIITAREHLSFVLQKIFPLSNIKVEKFNHSKGLSSQPYEGEDSIYSDIVDDLLRSIVSNINSWNHTQVRVNISKLILNQEASSLQIFEKLSYIWAFSDLFLLHCIERTQKESSAGVFSNSVTTSDNSGVDDFASFGLLRTFGVLKSMIADVMYPSVFLSCVINHPLVVTAFTSNFFSTSLEQNDDEGDPFSVDNPDSNNALTTSLRSRVDETRMSMCMKIKSIFDVLNLSVVSNLSTIPSEYYKLRSTVVERNTSKLKNSVIAALDQLLSSSLQNKAIGMDGKIGRFDPSTLDFVKESLDLFISTLNVPSSSFYLVSEVLESLSQTAGL